MSTPRAAAIAGVVFSLLLGASLVLVRISVPTNPSDAKQWLADSGRRHAVLVAVNLVPFAGIAFLWFIGVIRDRLGDREDRFFATVFLGSGLLFVAMLFGAAAVTASLATGFRGGVATSTGSSQTWHFGGSLAHTLLTTYGMRMAAVFMITMTTHPPPRRDPALARHRRARIGAGTAPRCERCWLAGTAVPALRARGQRPSAAPEFPTSPSKWESPAKQGFPLADL